MFFSLLKIIDEVRSPINGKIQVVKDVNGTRLVVDGISQSGWSMKAIWDKAIRQIRGEYPSPKSVLILGLGGGSVAEVTYSAWDRSNITGVDVDPVIVDLGRKYLNISKIKSLKVEIADAGEWVKEKVKEVRRVQKVRKVKTQDKYDIILIDLFVGEDIPQVFRSDEFFKNVNKLAESYGVVVVNHLYGPQDKENAKKMSKILRKTFAKVVTFYPSANIIFYCYPKVTK